MKNLKSGIIALILTTVVFASFGQTSANNYDDVTSLVQVQDAFDSPYVHIYGDVMNADIKRDKVSIGLYIQNDDCTWSEIESFVDNKYEFVLDRDMDYQIWFHDKNDTKVMYVKPGYQGNFVYRVDANFTTDQCVIMYPDETAQILLMDYISFYDLEPLIYQDGVILN